MSIRRAAFSLALTLAPALASAADFRFSYHYAMTQGSFVIDTNDLPSGFPFPPGDTSDIYVPISDGTGQDAGDNLAQFLTASRGVPYFYIGTGTAASFVPIVDVSPQTHLSSIYPSGSYFHVGTYNVGIGLDGGAHRGLMTVSAGVPEPGAWAMLLLGFGGIGAAMRRRRSRFDPALAQ